MGDIITESESLESEVLFKDIQINKNFLTCKDIVGEIHKYNLIKRKVKIGETVYITNVTKYTPLTFIHKNRFFKVTNLPTSEEFEWVRPYVVVDYCCVYDDQYLVLEEI